jgi:phospholipase/carboxylesterase
MSESRDRSTPTSPGLLLAVALATLVLACGKEPPAEKFKPLPTLEQLSFMEYLPGETVDAPDLPLVIAIHGAGDFPKNFRKYYKGIEVPVRVILPRAPIKAGRGYTWFECRPYPVKVDKFAPHTAQTADAVVELIGRLSARYPKAPKPIVTGFSLGGIISFAIAVRDPEVTDFMIPMAGALPKDLWPEDRPRGRLPKIRALHSKIDNIVKTPQTRRLVAHLKELGYDVQLKEYDDFRHEFEPPIQQELWRLIKAHLTSKEPR